MAFLDSLKLTEWLEGGFSDNPADPGGATEAGVTQHLWAALRGPNDPASVRNATPTMIANVYRKLWDSCKVADSETHSERSIFELLPSPADAVAFQLFINIPWRTFHFALQGILSLRAEADLVCDGVFGPKTFLSLRKWNGAELTEALLNYQTDHYKAEANPIFLHGLLNRVAKVRKWLATK